MYVLCRLDSVVDHPHMQNSIGSQLPFHIHSSSKT